MPVDPYPSPELDVNPFSALNSGFGVNGFAAVDALAGAHPAACQCPVCRGLAQVDSSAPTLHPGDAPQAFLNADARASMAANGKPSYTIDQAAMQIVRGAPGWSAAFRTPFTVTYGYRAGAPAVMPEDTGGFSRFNQAQIDQAELALKGWSDVANIRFVRMGFGNTGEGAYSNDAAILLGDYATGVSGASAFAYYPGSTSPADQAGDVWINSTLAYNMNPTVGRYGGQVLAHELGHAIGLAHPSQYNAAPSTTITYAADATYYEDSRQYTVMSYFSEANTGGAFQGAYAAAPLLDDIAAAQLEYGANMSTRTGDTVYGFNSNADRPWFIATSGDSKLVFAVWDAGGNDTFDFSGYWQNQVIDLRPGNFSNVGGLIGNVSIALGASIENAKGGSGNDLIYGNGFGDRLFGGPGDDTIFGGAGDDTINGGDGANYLRGGDGNDVIYGGSGFDDINGNKGDDTIHGGGGDDWVVGGQGNDLLYGDDGNDIILGNLGNDTLDGGAGADILRGGQGDDSISGGPGDDWISGDRGNDTMTGGPGADTFHTFAQAGIDLVLDFTQSDGDRVQIDRGTTYTVYQRGADTVIDMGGGNQMVLANVQVTSLTPGWIFEA